MNDFVNIALLGLVLRWSVSLFPYSGAGKPPMYGDYEAQRHWQEITVNLPITDWYRKSSDNDLLYWGLDYPPLTAYHSFLCGLVAKYIDHNFIMLHSSRGYESYAHKLFMRYTVLFIDLILFIPGAFLIVKSSKGLHRSNSGVLSCFAALLLYPGLYLIDYGHFQYNNFSLGLLVIAIAFIFRRSDYMASLFFSLALNYKQMELYHALPFFFYLLGRCFKQPSSFSSIKKLCVLGIVVVGTFACCWAPFISNIETAQDVVRRIFPINRGLYEDKVANFWCSLSVIFKLKYMFDNTTMALICLLVTFLLILPSCIHVLIYPMPNIFKYALVNVSLIFFLFSFHVHEKSILLVAIPACLIFSEEPLIVTWFFITSIISMLHLLLRDGLAVPTLALTLCSYYLYQVLPKDDTSKFSLSRTLICKYFFYFSLFGFIILAFFSTFVSPPQRYPDLFPVLTSFYSCAHYCLFCVYFHYCQFSRMNYDQLKEKS